MKIFIKLMLLSTVLAVAGPFFLKGPSGQPLMSLKDLGLPSLTQLFNASAITSGQSDEDLQVLTSAAGKKDGLYYKWQDENGVWQFTEEPPPDKQFSSVKTDPNANIIQSLSKETINQTLGIEMPKAANQAKNGAEGLEELSTTTLPLTQIPKLLENAQKARQMMEDHNKALEEL